MTYLNPVVQMGFKKFAAQMDKSGADGAIIPDLPMEESRDAWKILGRRDLALIPFLAPTSGKEREKQVDALGAPFLYYVSLTGVTGARRALSARLAPNLRRLRRDLKTPVTVGFGISTPQQAAQVGKDAEGVIIASALINLIERTPRLKRVKAVGAFCRSVVKAMKR
jgi:tryptophan synthase alpha chain